MYVDYIYTYTYIIYIQLYIYIHHVYPNAIRTRFNASALPGAHHFGLLHPGTPLRGVLVGFMAWRKEVSD